ncbi:unnamed protein product [Symbiodinium sp. CCMP2592]|nr:unnamed protein product [Symbiodinium sp. CCMP2592]
MCHTEEVFWTGAYSFLVAGEHQQDEQTYRMRRTFVLILWSSLLVDGTKVEKAELKRQQTAGEADSLTGLAGEEDWPEEGGPWLVLQSLPEPWVQQPSWGDRAASSGEASAESVSRQKQRQPKAAATAPGKRAKEEPELKAARKAQEEAVARDYEAKRKWEEATKFLAIGGQATMDVTAKTAALQRSQAELQKAQDAVAQAEAASTGEEGRLVQDRCAVERAQELRNLDEHRKAVQQEREKHEETLRVALQKVKSLNGEIQRHGSTHPELRAPFIAVQGAAEQLGASKRLGEVQALVSGEWCVSVELQKPHVEISIPVHVLGPLLATETPGDAASVLRLEGLQGASLVANLPESCYAVVSLERAAEILAIPNERPPKPRALSLLRAWLGLEGHVSQMFWNGCLPVPAAWGEVLKARGKACHHLSNFKTAMSLLEVYVLFVKRQKGLPLRDKDIQVLEKHHSKPRYRRGDTDAMGRGGKGQGRSSGGQQDYGGYRLWKGAYSPSQRPWRNNQADESWHGKPAFPSYTAMPRPPPKETHTHVAMPELHTPGSMVHDLQELLNGARRAEQKVARIVQARDREQAQYQEFQKQMKESFLKEKQRFAKSEARYEKDIADAVDEQNRARLLVRSAYLGIETIPVERAPGGKLTRAEEDLAWDQAREAWEKDEGSTMDGVLKRAMEPGPSFGDRDAVGDTGMRPDLRSMVNSVDTAWEAVRSAGAHDPAGARPMEIHPVTGEPDQADGSDPKAGVAEVEPNAGQAPGAPGNAERIRPSPKHTGQRDGGTRVPTSQQPPRDGIKEASKHAPSSAEQAHGLTLGERLEEKRRAMMPFHGQGPHNRPPAEPPKGMPSDEEKALPHSPGLTKLAGGERTATWVRLLCFLLPCCRKSLVSVKGPVSDLPPGNACQKIPLSSTGIVWAVPEPWRSVIQELQAQAEHAPAPIDDAAFPRGAASVFQGPEDQHINFLTHVQNHELQRPLENSNDIPVPPLHPPPEVGQPTPRSFEGVCYVLAPQYQAETLQLTLQPPVDMETFFNAVRDRLQLLRLPHCTILAPTVPQLGPDYASIVLAEFQSCDSCSIYVQGILVFLDARQAGQEVTHIYLPSSNAARTLHRLRDATRRFGDRWITDPPRGLPAFAQFLLEPEDTSDPEENDSLCIVPCAILKLDYTPELLQVAIEVPATPDELLQELSRVRHPEDADQFPQLLTVLPQPSCGVVVCIAHQTWNAAPDLICIDTTSVDGRLFLQSAPTYATKGDLVRLAGLLTAIDYDVHYGVDQAPMPWSPDNILPSPQTPEAHCLVHRGMTRLCVDALREPMRYRAAIAGTTGADPARMRLFAAHPSPTNVAIQGVHCPYVIAVAHPPPGNVGLVWHAALVDCRPLGAAFKEVLIFNGYVPERTLHAKLADYVPWGFHLLFDGRTTDNTVRWIAPGQVIVATLAGSGSQDHAVPPATSDGSAPQEALSSSVDAAARAPVPDRDVTATAPVPAVGNTNAYPSLLTTGLIIPSLRQKRHRDMPWPLAEGVTVQLQPGDLVSIQPANHAIAILVLGICGCWLTIGSVSSGLSPHADIISARIFQGPYAQALNFLPISSIRSSQRQPGTNTMQGPEAPVTPSSLQQETLPMAEVDGAPTLALVRPLLHLVCVPSVVTATTLGGRATASPMTLPRRLILGLFRKVLSQQKSLHSFGRPVGACSSRFMSLLMCTLTAPQPYPFHLAMVMSMTQPPYQANAGLQPTSSALLAIAIFECTTPAPTSVILGMKSLTFLPNLRVPVVEFLERILLPILQSLPVGRLSRGCGLLLKLPFGQTPGPSYAGKLLSHRRAALRPFLLQRNAKHSLAFHLPPIGSLDQSCTPDGAEQGEFVGRTRFLRDQLQAEGVCVAALQETRSRASETYVSASHVRFTSAKAEDGSCGVELWFSRDRSPFTDLDGGPIYFRPGDFLAVHWTPRILAVRYTHSSLRILFVCIHAPHNASPGRDAWWQDFFLLLRRISQDAQLVILGDYNLHMHFSHAAAVGDLVWGTTNPDPPTPFYRLLDHFALWIPSTSASCHPGDTATWHPPNGAGAARLDYIAIPAHWRVASGGSIVNSSLDWGQSRADHFAVQLWAQGSISFGHPRRRQHPRLDTAAMRTSEGREILRHICYDVPLQPWSLDVHRHAQALDNHFRSRLVSAFPVKRSQCRHEYFRASTWQLRGRREWLRKRVKGASRQLYQWQLRAAFRAWQTGRCLSGSCLASWASVLWALRDLPTFLTELRQSSQQLRLEIRYDHLQHIRTVAAASETSTTQSTVQRLRTLTGGPKRKQRERAPLPAVERSDGSLATTDAEARQCWLDHFSAIEAGTPGTPSDIVSECMTRQASKCLEDYEVSHRDAPTLGDLEWALRSTSTDRAYGVDGLPGELLHYCAPFLARPLYQLQLKSLLTLAEPIQHKGGVLHCVYKRKGPRQQCSSYRGILVSSVVSKSLHKLLRRKCVPALRNAATPLQVGGLPGHPVTLPAHATRLYQSACLQRGQCHCILFLDLQEAFYRIVRPLVTGGPLTEEALAKACQAVSLPAGVYHDIRRHLQQPALSLSSGASHWTTRALEETLQGTWFRFPDDEAVVTTAIGSRPGDSLSDLVFSLLFAQVLRQVRASLHASGSMPEIPWHDTMSGRLTPLPFVPNDTIAILDATWMDDLSMLLQAPDSATLVQRLRTGASTLLDTCLEHALLPNLKRGKTEAIVHLRAKGARQARRHLFADNDGALSLDCRLWPTARLRLTASYRHLGGVLHHRGSLIREVKARAAQAWTAFNSRKKQIFASPRVSKAEKALLFDSLVATTLFYGSGTWPEPSDECVLKLTGTLRSMACQMLRPMYTTTQAWHLGTAYVLSLVGLPSVSTYLHAHRLRYLLSCLVLDVPEIWALAHWEGIWLRSVASSVQWLWELTDVAREYPTWECAWAVWKEEAKQRPGRWKARIRRAQSAAVARECWHASVLRHQGLLLKQLQGAGAVVSATSEVLDGPRECCAICRKHFKDYRAWSVHAFSTHGRTDEMRRLAPGTQCPICMKHFTSAVKLSRHLGYSQTCRDRLLAAGSRHAPEPGVGSRKAHDDGADLTPVLQASGPELCPPPPAHFLAFG